MGTAATASADFPGGPEDGRGSFALEGLGEREFQHVSIGNPQCAIEVGEGLEELDLGAIGPWIEAGADGRFPNRTNVSFWRVEDADARRIRARIFERGVGETLSSGTGATRRRGRGPSSAACRAPSRSSSTAASSRSRSARSSRST